ncbi:MAG: 30S ribosomal protein S6 [Defluviitaleaceae bacterium]|nr:30S ribosomal protein S6 [Defluviitaleaceae bacterium]
MNKYELAIILNANLEDELLKEEVEKVHAIIARFGGLIDKIDDWGKRKLAYEINKQTEGFYSFITFTSDGDAPSKMEDRLRIMENLLRFLIIRQED